MPRCLTTWAKLIKIFSVIDGPYLGWRRGHPASTFACRPLWPHCRRIGRSTGGCQGPSWWSSAHLGSFLGTSWRSSWSLRTSCLGSPVHWLLWCCSWVSYYPEYCWKAASRSQVRTQSSQKSKCRRLCCNGGPTLFPGLPNASCLTWCHDFFACCWEHTRSPCLWFWPLRPLKRGCYWTLCHDEARYSCASSWGRGRPCRVWSGRNPLNTKKSLSCIFYSWSLDPWDRGRCNPYHCSGARQCNLSTHCSRGMRSLWPPSWPFPCLPPASSSELLAQISCCPFCARLHRPPLSHPRQASFLVEWSHHSPGSSWFPPTAWQAHLLLRQSAYPWTSLAIHPAPSWAFREGNSWLGWSPG